MDRLSRLWKIRDNWATRQDSQAFEDYFIGALSVLVGDEEWDKALKSAREYALEAGRKEKDEVKVEVIS